MKIDVEYKERFSGYPFKHAVFDNWWDPLVIELVKEEIDVIDDSEYFHARVRASVKSRFGVHEQMLENKYSISFDRFAVSRFVKELHRRLSSPDFIEWVEKTIGIVDLHFDPIGGGVHMIKPGGLLETHVDFNVDDHKRWRRVNVLIYLNECGPGGELRLTTGKPGPQVVIPPQANRMVVFECSETSWHGHPVPLGPGPDRKSIAAYYFTKEAPPDAEPPHSTKWLVLE